MPGRWSRRWFLAAGMVGAGVFGLGRRSPADATGGVARLEAAGAALAPAVRIVPEPPAPVVEPPADGELLFPVLVGADDSCYVLDNFGDCRGSGCSRSHEGVDMMADRGLPVLANADGELTKQYVDSGLTYGAGNGWTLTGDDGVVYRYFHLDRYEDALEEGSTVVQGQVIGYVGNTGTSGALSDQNYHLHFEYRPNDVAVDSFHILQRPEHVDFES